MNRNLLKMLGIIVIVIGIGILSLVSWVFSDKATTKSKREFQKRVITEQQKVRSKN